VDINTTTSSDPFAGGGGQPVARGAGTGMIVTSDGEILTNNHVIEGATSIRVTVASHAGVYSATVLGADPTKDVALLQIHGLSNLPTVTLADSSNLTVGQDVVAIGNALGRGGAPTVTTGQITALNRDITVGDDRGGSEHLSGLIQMDATIQPGDSGGPLVNTSGQVVGMITAAGSQGFGGTGSVEGFAIPTSTAANIANQIRSGNGSSTVIIGQPGYLGIGARDLDQAAAAQLGLGVSKGALVVNVSPSSPAARAGLAAESVITAVDGKTVGSSDELRAVLYQRKPGDVVRLTWVNDSGTHTASIRLISGPAA
jgi:S1-C subfamily serine protease